jgi:glutamate-ammonia-ligase adenylyltransferase
MVSPEVIDGPAARDALARAAEAGVPVKTAIARDLVQRTGAAAPAVLPLLLARPALAEAIAHEIERHGRVTPARVPPPPPAVDRETAQVFLRESRDQALVRTALRELYGHADVDRTAREWSDVAARCCDVAVEVSRRLTEARHGIARDPRGERVPFVVLGMGKLAGEELNLGSDIDLCFFYGTDEGAAGERTVHEHFARVGSLLTTLLDEVTAQGFAFRVDLRLRPEGSRGPMANALASAERYYETWGRPWERAALLRARPCAGDLPFGQTLLETLEPFVFRRAVDPAIAVEVAKMLDRSRAELLQDDARDLKLGTGGIREAEFFIQSLQLVWGGRHRALRVPGTVQAVQRLRALALLSHREAEDFLDAWAVLRRAEHRVQVMASYATHLLPVEPPRRIALARSLGYASVDAFEAELARARSVIRALFDTLFSSSAIGPGGPASGGASRSPESALCDLVARAVEDPSAHEPLAALAVDTLDVRDGDSAAFALVRLGRKADAPLGVVGRERAPELGPRLLSEVRDAPDPDRALARLADLLERVGTALPRYAARLADNPDTARALVGLLGTSDALARALLTRPELVDALLTVGVEAPADHAMDELLDARLREAGTPDEDPIESRVGALRRAIREVELAVGLGDIGHAFSSGEVSRRLSALAEGVVRRCFAIAGEETAARFGLRPSSREPLEGISIVALGSLAARELGYGGDVDVIVLFDGEGDSVGGTRRGVSFAEFVGRVTQRAIALLSAPHPDGPGYPVDIRLRPSGAQGTLITTLGAFERYHGRTGTEPRGADWERQALIRARPVGGDPAVSERAASLLARIAFDGPAPDPAEIRRIRTRIERELGRERADTVALKHGPGALIDVEFAAQALQMTYGSDPSLRSPTTRLALRALRERGLLPREDADALLHAEKTLRRALLAARLVHGGSHLDLSAHSSHAIARKLGYRSRQGRSAVEALASDVDRARRDARAAFDRAMDHVALARANAETHRAP